MTGTEADSIEEVVVDKAGMSLGQKLLFAVLAALVLAVAGMYVWKVSAVKGVQEKIAQLEAENATARNQLAERANQLYMAQTKQALSQFSVPFAWAVRREMMANNLDQVDQYFTDLVKLPGFKSAVLSGPDGKVLVSSDRKNLAVAFDSIYPADYLQASDIKVEQGSSGSLVAVVPIMGLNQHLGTVVLEYTPAQFSLQ